MLTSQELQSLRNVGNEHEAASDEIELLRATLREVLAIARSWNLFSVMTMDRKPAACALRLHAAQKVLDGPNRF